MASAYIEVQVEGGRRAVLEAGSIIGIITSPDKNSWDAGTDAAPVAVVIRGGEAIMVVGQSPGVILGRALLVRKNLRDLGADILVDWLNPEGAADGQEVQE